MSEKPHAGPDRVDDAGGGEPRHGSTLAWLDHIRIDDEPDVCSRADEFLYSETNR